MKFLPALISAFLPFGVMAQTFTSTVNQVIPDDGSTVQFGIDVSSLPDVLDTVFGIEQLCLNLNHTYVEDMKVRLEAPDGKSILLFAGVGGGGHDFINTCVAEEGLSFNLSAAPFTGTFQSFGFLGSFNKGTNPNGTWKLVIVDTYPFADEGFLIDWSITFGNNPASPFGFTSSNLPIVKLTTLDTPINNDEKVPVLMQVIDNGPGNPNFLNQTDYAYEGTILAEWQGFSGTGYPKKNYDFDLIDALGQKIDTSLLGLPAENDWIFKSEFTDPTLIKNSLTYTMARKMGGYAPRTAACEIMLDDEYIGIYILTEKVKRGKNRVDIAKLTPADTSGVDLTGGYIVELNINGYPPDWVSEYLPINYPDVMLMIEFRYNYPKKANILPQQADYIKNYIDHFEDVLQSNNFMHPDNGYRKWIDADVFIDFLIVNEFSLNFDSYGRSTFLYKEKDTDGGLLKIGPPWDYDRSLDFTQTQYKDRWIWERTADFWPFPFWWSRMWEDPSYRQQIACRWQNLRESKFTNASFHGVIDSLVERLAQAQPRQARAWNNLGAFTYPQHLDSMRAYLDRRLFWMDSTLASEHPKAIFSASQNAPNTPLWTFEPVDTTADAYFWDFGDGNTSTMPNPIHQYNSGGQYTVQLTINYGKGCTVSNQQNIEFAVSETSTPYIPKIEVSPNPFFDHIYLKNTPHNAIYELSNTVGQIVFTGRDIGQTDFSHLPQGVYYLKIQGNAHAGLRLLKQSR